MLTHALRARARNSFRSSYPSQSCHLQVPQYMEKSGDETKDKSHWKPKHHMTSHIPVDILRLGPARGYWCYSYEGYNKVIKKITRGSNFKNICKRVADVW